MMTKGTISREVAGGSCSRCSRCCGYFSMDIDEPETRREYDDLAWIISHENVAIHICDGTWQVVVYNRCKHLMAEGGCAIYERRPAICREHEPGECENGQSHLHDYDDVERVFTTMDELWDYRRELISRKRSDAARKAAKTRREGKARGPEIKSPLPFISLINDF